MKFQICVISASNLPDVGTENSKMKVYAKVKIGNREEVKSETDKNNEENPSWNFNFDCNIKPWEVKGGVVMLCIKLFREGENSEKDDNDMYIGEIHQSLYRLFVAAQHENMSKEIPAEPLLAGSRPLSAGSSLRFSYTFRILTVNCWKKFFLCASQEAVEIPRNYQMNRTLYR